MHLALMRPVRRRSRGGPRVRHGDTAVPAMPARTFQHTPSRLPALTMPRLYPARG